MKKKEFQYNILYACTDEKEKSSEIHFHHNQGVAIYGTGKMGLLRKNLLLRSIKYPAIDGKPFQSLNVFLDQERLKEYSALHGVKASGIYNEAPVVDLSGDDFIKGYFDSLVPYFNTDVQLTEQLAQLKTNEAIVLLLRHRKFVNLLMDFSTPYKIDLEAFMSQNYIYNIPMAKFALLTGRSLATFKRDFKKVFQNSPEKWLIQKRLERAHFLISYQKLSPSSVYQDVGFENFSHFSTAFKKKFGYSASTLTNL